MRPPFTRTVCGCDQCVACCREQPGFLIPGDLERITTVLPEPEIHGWALHFWRSPGALLANTATGTTYRLGTITPRLTVGRCVFLDGHNRCRIHAVAPFGCAYFDTHMAQAEANRRSLWGLRLIMSDGDYRALRLILPEATSHRPRLAFEL